MPDVPLNFTREEYADRLARTRHAMAARGIDTLIVSDPSNMAWLTGYDGWSFYVHQGVVVPPDGDPVWWGRSQDVQGALRTVYMGEDRILGYPDIYVQSTERHPMQVLAAQLDRARLGQGHDRRRDGQLLVLGRRLRHAAAATCPMPASSTPRRWSTGSAR